ncbi:TolC family protein [Algoriphagus machipongonensis]|uniref:Exported outer membrane protein n=1 Tax=Algoriphagus machipongonensis TaxID=388413 RepID=A3HYB2_9BACT|nr:TolC family protein [Algoriphagus machipongonensis]EAZ80248.1 putative exported outer membrane protein [Algoriphagus machipongonensis]
MKYFCFRSVLAVSILLLGSSVFTETCAQDSVSYTLQEMVQRAKDRSPASLRAKTARENRYWQYRQFKSNYNPQLRLTGTIPAYSQAFNNVTQPDGTIEFRPVKQNLVDLGLGLQQVISPTGGMVSINTSTSRFDNFLAGDNEIQTRWSGIPMNVSLDQPIFAYNPYKWDKKIMPLLFEESKREFVEESEQISMMVTELFFNYLIAQVNFEIATQNLKNTEQIFGIEQKRYDLGATFEDELLQVELQTLQAKQDLAKAKLDLESSSLAVNSFIGLNQAANILLIPPSEVPEFDVDVNEAIEYAFQNRSEALGFDRQLIEAEATVAEAKGQRMQMNLRASYGYNNAAFTLSDIYQNPNTQALVNLGISVPILDWGRNKSRMSIAKANQQFVEYTVEQETINFEQEIFTKVRNFLMIRERINVTRKSDEVAEKRYQIALNRYQTGNVTVTDLNIAQGQKDDNKRAYYNSLKEYWMAYFELRALTLYDFENDQLLYIPEEE